MSEIKCEKLECNQPAEVLGLCWSCAYWVYDRKTS